MYVNRIVYIDYNVRSFHAHTCVRLYVCACVFNGFRSAEWRSGSHSWGI